MTLGEIQQRLQHIADAWRCGTAGDQKKDLADLDDLLADIDNMEKDSAAATDIIDELRGRIEILMDEIDISLGIEPPPITGFTEVNPTDRPAGGA